MKLWSKFSQVIQHQLTQGATPHALALTLAMAFSLGTVPALGTTTMLCFLFGLMFSLNQPLIQILNYIFYPLQILLLPVFLGLGQRLFSDPVIDYDLGALTEEFKADWQLFFVHYAKAGFHAFVVWLLVMPAISFIIYRIALVVFLKLKAQRERAHSR